MEVGNQNHLWPKWAQNFVTPEEAKQISEAVAEAEKKTQGEIVPIIVRRSSTIGHVPYLLTLCLFILLFAFEIPQSQRIGHTGEWILFAVAALVFILSFPLSRLTWIQRIFVPQGDQAFQVEARALLEFYQAEISKTQGRTGILLFLSLMERKAVVLADEAISQKLPKETWVQICQEMVGGIGKGQTAEGIIKAVHRSY